MPDLSGEVIDNRYELISVIASGGMASIYKATDLRLDRLVAVKIMHSHLASDEEFVNRFIREAKAIAALSHPNIVSIQDQGWNEGGSPAVFIVMEYVDGFTLHDLLVEKGHLTPQELLHYLIPVVSALAQAHALGISHRDLKPENILISKDGRIKIADFGLATGGVLGSTMTVASSVVLGSVSYLSPEQVERGISDSRSDIYSLGVMFFELLTGGKPFRGDTPIQIAFKHVRERIPAPSSVRPGIPSELDELVLKATSPNPDHRQKNGGELLEQLQSLQVKLDPKRSQMSLDLDLPLLSPTKKAVRTRQEVRVGNTLIQKVKSLTEPIAVGTTTRRRTSKRVRRNRYIASLLLIFTVLLALYLFAWPFNGGVTIPSVVGESQVDATRSLAALGIKTSVSLKKYDSSVPAGDVISSNPGGGARLGKGGTVALVLSEGPQVLPTPSSIPSPTVTISKIHISSYVGLTSDQAQSELTAAGIVVNQIFAYSDTVATGIVISQSPNGPKLVPSGSTVTIDVSEGSATVFVPNVYSLSRSAATTQLENLQLKVTVRKIGGGTKVTNISPAVGTKVKRGSTVVITLG